MGEGKWVWWLAPHSLPSPASSRVRLMVLSIFCEEGRRGCTKSLPGLCRGPELVCWEDTDQTSAGEQKDCPPFSYTETHAPNTDSGFGWGRLLLGKCFWLWKPWRGPGWASDERGRDLAASGWLQPQQGGRQRKLCSFLPGQLSPKLCTVYHRSLFSLTTKGKGADIQSQNHVQEKRLDTYRFYKEETWNTSGKSLDFIVR